MCITPLSSQGNQTIFDDKKKGVKEDPDDGGNLFRRQQIPIGSVRAWNASKAKACAHLFLQPFPIKNYVCGYLK